MGWYKTAQVVEDTSQTPGVSYTDYPDRGNWYLEDIPCQKCKAPIWRFEMGPTLLCIECATSYNASGTKLLEPKMNEGYFGVYLQRLSSEIKKHIGKRFVPYSLTEVEKVPYEKSGGLRYWPKQYQKPKSPKLDHSENA
jgi:hypothetical protein